MKVSQPLSRSATTTPVTTPVTGLERPVIKQINMAGRLFDISAEKDWEQNNAEHKDFIANRTHYVENKIFMPGEELPTASHTFANTYSVHGAIQTRDRWYIDAPWFNRNTGTYNFTFYIKDCPEVELRNYVFSSADKENITNIFSAVTALNQKILETEGIGTIIRATTIAASGDKKETKEKTFRPRVSFDETGYFSVVGEPYDVKPLGEDGVYQSDYPVSLETVLTITPVALPEDTPEEEEINYTHSGFVNHLEAKYIPIDNKTIKRTTDGKLFVDDTFEKDFMVTAPFGKYPAKSWVAATNKTTKEVLIEAFAETLQPNINPPAPILTLSCSAGKNPYEVGEMAKVNWSLYLNPGYYEYGTQQKNDSNIWVDEVYIDASTLKSQDSTRPSMLKYSTTQKIYEQTVLVDKEISNESGFNLNALDNTPIRLFRSGEIIENYIKLYSKNEQGEDNTINSFTPTTNPAKALLRPSIIKYPASGSGTKITGGVVEVPVVNQSAFGQLKVKVKYSRNDTDPSADISGKPSDIDGLPVKISVATDQAKEFDADGNLVIADPEQFDALYDKLNGKENTTIASSSNLVNGKYKWFWRYYTADNHAAVGAFGTEDFSEVFRSGNSSGGETFDGIPTRIQTTAMKYIYFAAPLNDIKKILCIGDSNESYIKLYNTDTKSSVSSGVYRLLDEKGEAKKVYIADASGKTAWPYEIFYLVLDGADKKTNNYTIDCTNVYGSRERANMHGSIQLQ